MNDTGLHTLMNFMRENNALFYFDKKSDEFALVIGHGVLGDDLITKGSFHGSFGVPEHDDDIEKLFIKPVIIGMERCKDET